MEAKTLNEIHKQGIDAFVKVLGPVRLRSGSSRYMIREAAITPKNENSGLKRILTNISRRLSLTERKNPVHNFFHQYPPLGKPGFPQPFT